MWNCMKETRMLVGWGPWELATPVKAIRVGVGLIFFKKNSMIRVFWGHMIVVASPFLLSGTSDILFKWYFLVIGNHLAITTYPDRPYPIPWPCRWHQWKIVGWHWPNRSIELPTNPDDNIKTFLWASPASFSFDVGSFQSNLTIFTTMWKNYIHYSASGFELTTSWLWVCSVNH